MGAENSSFFARGTAVALWGRAMKQSETRLRHHLTKTSKDRRSFRDSACLGIAAADRSFWGRILAIGILSLSLAGTSGQASADSTVCVDCQTQATAQAQTQVQQPSATAYQLGNSISPILSGAFHSAASPLGEIASLPGTTSPYAAGLSLESSLSPAELQSRTTWDAGLTQNWFGQSWFGAPISMLPPEYPSAFSAGLQSPFNGGTSSPLGEQAIRTLLPGSQALAWLQAQSAAPRSN